MAATRVRLLPEHRNGNGNYLGIRYGGQFVSCHGENDLAALEAAYLVMLQEIGFSARQVEEFRSKHKAPSHD